MDVILLSRMVGELMPGLDSLSLPGLGTFTAEQVGASFSDKGYTINPPYRRLSFNGTQTDDGRLAGLYASSNGVSQEEADTILRAFTASLSKELSAHSSIELPGLGRLRSTREGHLFFVPDEDLDISPEACGLTSVSLKFHSVTLPPLPDLPQPAGEAVGGNNEGTVKKKGAVKKNSKVRRARRRPSKTFYFVAAPILAAAIIIGGFAALSRLAPSFTDKLLYTPEQLAIINTPEWN